MAISYPKIFTAAAIFIALGVLCLLYAHFIEPDRLVVNHTTLEIKGWNPAFDGLTIAMLGDIHAGSHYVTEEKLREVVAKTNEQQPDVIVMLGDYVTQTDEKIPLELRGVKMPVETIAANLAGLKAKYGVFAVLGNHDGWYSDDLIANSFTKNGYRVLQNEIAAIEKDGKHLRILGFKDHLQLTKGWRRTSADAKALIAATGGSGDIIALQHSPDIMPIITGGLSISDNLKLVLAAHTHGGQVWMPIFGRPIVPSTFGQKYAYGHFRENNVDLFVTSGVGLSVLPLRFMVPPEIVVLTIRSGPPS